MKATKTVARSHLRTRADNQLGRDPVHFQRLFARDQVSLSLPETAFRLQSIAAICYLRMASALNGGEAASHVFTTDFGV